MKDKLVKRFVIGTFVTLYLLVSIISTIHVIDFFEMSNPYWLAVTLAIGFEIGAAASLASLIILDKMNKTVVWALFLAITLMQMQGNMYYAFINLDDFTAWSELFDLIEEDVLYQKRILAFVSGAILPLIALGFIKSLVDYIKPKEEEDVISEGQLTDSDMGTTRVEPTQEERGQILADMMVKDQELGLYDDWDSTINDGLEDVEYHENITDDREPVQPEDVDIPENWDDDHALDMVLNDMVNDMDVKDFEEIRVEKTPIEPVNYVVDPVVNPTSVGAIVEKLNSTHLPQDEQALLNKALRDKANKDKELFIKKDRNDS